MAALRKAQQTLFVTLDDSKKCYKCGRVLPIDAFCIDRSTPDGRQARCRECRSKHYQSDKETVKAQSLASYYANKEHRDAQSLRYYYEHAAEQSERMAEWYIANRVSVLETTSAYQKANRPAYTARTAHRRATQIRATPSWANVALIKEFYRTAANLSATTGIIHHVDHIVPLRSKWVCGLHCEANLQVMTGPENVSKGNAIWPDMGALRTRRVKT